MDKWQQWIQEARDTRSDLRGFSEQMNRFSVEHARILMMLQRHSGVEKKPSMYSDLPQSYESR
jgi:hypothetical protein